MMYVPVSQPAITAQQAIEASPLQNAVDELAAAPSEVQHEFARQVFTNFSISVRDFRHLPSEQQKSIVRQAFFVAAARRIMIIPPRSQEIVDLVNRMSAGPSPDFAALALAYEKMYHQLFKTWPPIVPVNVEALVQRMLNEREIR